MGWHLVVQPRITLAPQDADAVEIDAIFAPVHSFNVGSD